MVQIDPKIQINERQLLEIITNYANNNVIIPYRLYFWNQHNFQKIEMLTLRVN